MVAVALTRSLIGSRVTSTLIGRGSGGAGGASAATSAKARKSM